MNKLSECKKHGVERLHFTLNRDGQNVSKPFLILSITRILLVMLRTYISKTCINSKKPKKNSMYGMCFHRVTRRW